MDKSGPRAGGLHSLVLVPLTGTVALHRQVCASNVAQVDTYSSSRHISRMIKGKGTHLASAIASAMAKSMNTYVDELFLVFVFLMYNS